MATITKTIGKKGRLSFRFRVSNGYDIDGKQIIKSMTWTAPEGMTERQAAKEAQKQAVLFEEKCRNNEAVNTVRHIKFSELADEWLNLVSDTKEQKTASIERLKSCKERTYKAIGNIYINKLTYRTIQQFIISLSKDGTNQRTGKGLSEKSQKHYLTFISDVMNYAIKLELIAANPCKNVHVVKTEKKSRDVYSLDELKLILDRLEQKAPTNYRLFFMFMAYCGLRRGEVLGLEWKDIDLNSGVVSIVRTSQYRNKSTGIYTTTPKTKGSYRSMILPKDILDILAVYKQEQSDQRRDCGDQWVDSDRLFIKWNGSPMHPNTPYTWLERFCKREDLPFKGEHSFRHSFATQAITSGKIDIKTVSAILGHSQTSTTLNIYAHEVAEANAVAVNVIADILNDKKS